MLELLNKLAWFLCFALAFGVSSTLFGGYDGGGFIIAILSAFILKGVFFPKDYILSRLVFFKKQILSSDTLGDNNFVSQERVILDTREDEEIQQEEYKEEAEGIFEQEPQEENIYLDTLIENTSEPEEVREDYIEEDMYIEPKSSPAYSYKTDTANIPTAKRELNMFEKFFAENLLLKVGGIFVFLGVLFLLGLVYTIMGPVAKLILGFIIGGLCYAAGIWLDKKGYIQESRTVLGVALLINYLVILWGRYYLGSDESSSSTILSVGITFFFLICNTLLAIATSQVYNSRPLLIFAFVVAYINPFLLGESSSEPYTLLGYTMIVTFGAMFMAYKKKDEVLFPLSFIFAAILIVLAPWSDASGWVTKLLCINTLGAVGLYVSTVFKKQYMYAFEFLIAGIFFLIGIMGVLGGEILSPLQFSVMGASSLALMTFCYIAMHRGVYLYSIGTVGTILTLTPVLLQNGLLDGYILIASLIIITFGVMNIGIALLQPKKLLSENIGNTISGLISGSLFLILMIFVFGNEYSTQAVQGLCFFGLSIVYALVAYVLAQSIGIKNISINKDYENLIYSIFSLGVSLFTLAVAFVFAEQKHVICIAWLLEANVLFYLASRIKSKKVAFVGLVLLMIGVVKFVDFADITLIFSQAAAGTYGMLVTFIIVLVSFILNLVFIKPTTQQETSYLGNELTLTHNILHVIGMGFLLIWGHRVIGISDDWFSLLYYSSFIMILGVIYEKLLSPGLQKIHLLAYLACMGVHILAFYSDAGSDSLRLGISTIIAGIYSLPFIYDYIKNGVVKNENLFYVFLGYMLSLSTLYLYHIFGSSFVVTSYWALISFLFISYNITKDNIDEKTVAIYIIPMAIISALFYEYFEIGTVLLFLQSLILFFYAYTQKSLRTSVLGLVIFTFGVLMLANALDPVQSYSMIIAGFIIFIACITSLLFTQDTDESSYLEVEFIWVYNIAHVIAMILLAVWGHNVLGITSDWFSLLYYSVIIMILGVVYEKMSGMGLQQVHLSSYVFLMGTHILLFASNLETADMNLGVSTLVVGMYALPFIYDYLRKGTIENKPLFIVFLSYLFMLSTLYVYQISGITFMVTLYWGMLAFGITWYGIAKDVLYVRTLGLYLITLTASKVLLYDIWVSVDDTVSRVIALIVVGILMITLSTMYSKKFGNNLNSEFKLSNLFPKDNKESHEKYKTSKIKDQEEEIIETKSTVQKDIEKIDITGISSVKLSINKQEKPTQLRAENLIKIAKLITNTYKKTEFKAGELKKAYKLIESDYKSELSPAQYKKIRSLVKKFVDEGGNIELIKK